MPALFQTCKLFTHSLIHSSSFQPSSPSTCSTSPSFFFLFYLHLSLSFHFSFLVLFLPFVFLFLLFFIRLQLLFPSLVCFSSVDSPACAVTLPLQQSPTSITSNRLLVVVAVVVPILIVSFRFVRFSTTFLFLFSFKFSTICLYILSYSIPITCILLFCIVLQL